MESRDLKRKIYSCKKQAWKYTFICIVLAGLLWHLNGIYSIVAIFPFLFSSFVSLIDEIDKINIFNSKLEEIEEV